MSFGSKLSPVNFDGSLKKKKLSSSSSYSKNSQSIEEPKKKVTLSNFIKKKLSHKKNHSLCSPLEYDGEIPHYDVTTNTLDKSNQIEKLNKGIIMSLIDSTINNENLLRTSTLPIIRNNQQYSTKDISAIIKVDDKQRLYYESVFMYLVNLSNLHNNNQSSQYICIKDTVSIKFFNHSSISLEALNNLRFYLIENSVLDLDAFVQFMHQAVLAYHGYDYDELKYKLVKEKSKNVDLILFGSLDPEDSKTIHNVNDSKLTVEFQEPLFSMGKLTDYNVKASTHSLKSFELLKQWNEVKIILAKLTEERLQLETLAFKLGFVYDESELAKIEMYFIV